MDTVLYSPHMEMFTLYEGDKRVWMLQYDEGVMEKIRVLVFTGRFEHANGLAFFDHYLKVRLRRNG